MIEQNFPIEKKEKTSYPPLPENVYQVELLDVSVEEKETTNRKDNTKKLENFFKFEFGLLDGEENGETLRGRRAWLNYVPTYFYIGDKKNKLYTVIETLLRREITTAEEATFDAMKMNDLVGMQCRIIIKHSLPNAKGAVYGNIDSLLKVSAILPRLTDAEKSSKESTDPQPVPMTNNDENIELAVANIPF
jgi:hypothetical protein